MDDSALTQSDTPRAGLGTRGHCQGQAGRLANDRYTWLQPTTECESLNVKLESLNIKQASSSKKQSFSHIGLAFHLVK